MNRNKLIRHTQLATRIAERHNPLWAIEIDGVRMGGSVPPMTRARARECIRAIRECDRPPVSVRLLKRKDDGSGYEVVR